MAGTPTGSRYVTWRVSRATGRSVTSCSAGVTVTRAQSAAPSSTTPPASAPPPPGASAATTTPRKLSVAVTHAGPRLDQNCPTSTSSVSPARTGKAMLSASPGRSGM